MIPNFGYSTLWVALACAIFSLFATANAYRVSPQRQLAWLRSAERSTYATLGLLTTAAFTLWYLFFTDDFSVNYVWGHSSREQALPYKISALWGGQAGSLLLWAWLLALYAVLVARFGRKSEIAASEMMSQRLVPTAVSIINVVTVFFVGMIVLAANPFLVEVAKDGTSPQNGLGLNPLLQNYWMQIHPPTLYTGYVGCTVPFAFAMAALLHRETGGEWLAIVRRWTLLPWVILTIGIIMGGRWAYETLGWGGYWAWDPVENASLMPWLTGTAFIHSIMIQARRGLLKTWNMTLVSLTFLLSIFGTFITRSGVVSSVHSFAESNIGPYFLVFLALALVASFGLIAWRKDDLRPDGEMESPLSREGAFLLNNWVLLGATAAVLWGTIYPSINEAFTGSTVTVDISYFTRVMVPLGLILLALTGIGPLMAWRRMTPQALLKALEKPLIAAILAAPVLWILSKFQTGAATSFSLAVFVVAAIVGEFWRGTKARQRSTGEDALTAFSTLLSRNRPRYGGYIVHLGIVTLMIGATGNAFKIETPALLLKKGAEPTIIRNEQGRTSEYSLRFEYLGRPQVMPKEKQDEVAAAISILRFGQPVKDMRGNNIVMTPYMDFFKTPGSGDADSRAGQEPQTASRPAIWVTPSHDLYLAMTGYDSEKQTVEIKAYLNPLVSWIWVSCLFFIGGTALSLWPQRRASAERDTAETVSAKPRRETPSTTRGEVLAASSAPVTASRGKGGA